MNEHDVVRVKETVLVMPNFEDDPIEIKAGWRGTIVAHADNLPFCIEFNEDYRSQPFLLELDAANLNGSGLNQTNDSEPKRNHGLIFL